MTYSIYNMHFFFFIELYTKTCFANEKIYNDNVNVPSGHYERRDYNGDAGHNFYAILYSVIIISR